MNKIKKLIIATTCASLLSPALTMYAMNLNNDLETENSDSETKESALDYQVAACAAAASAAAAPDVQPMEIDRGDSDESEADDISSEDDNENSQQYAIRESHAAQSHHKKRKKPAPAAVVSKTPHNQMREMAEILEQKLKQELKNPHEHTGHNCCLETSAHYVSLKRSRTSKAQKNNEPVPEDSDIFWGVMLNIKDKLSKAVRSQNSTLVRELAKDPVVRACWHLIQNKEKLNMLSAAVENNDLEAVKALVENGFDINCPNHETKNRSFPLLIAIERSTDAMINYLIKQGALLYEPERLLNAAIKTHNSPLIVFLLKNNIDYSAITVTNALESNCFELIKHVLFRNIPFGHIPQFITTNNLLDKALAQGNTEFFKWIIQLFTQSNINIPPIDIKNSVIAGKNYLIKIIQITADRNKKSEAEKLAIKNKSILSYLTNTLYCLVKNGLGTSDCYQAIIQNINQPPILAIAKAEKEINEGCDAATRTKNQQFIIDMTQWCKAINSKLHNAINAGIQERYKKIISTKTLPEEGTDLFDIPSICAIIGEYESACDYQGESTIASYAQAKSAEIMAQKYPIQQKDPLVEYWDNNWQDLLKMLDNDPSIPFANPEHQKAYAVFNSASALESSSIHETTPVMQNAVSAADAETEYICCARYPECACAHPAPAKRQRRK